MHKTHTKLLSDREKKKNTHDKLKLKYEEATKQAETAIVNLQNGEKEGLAEKLMKGVMNSFFIYFFIFLFFLNNTHFYIFVYCEQFVCVFFFCVTIIIYHFINLFLFLFIYFLFLFISITYQSFTPNFDRVIVSQTIYFF